MLIRLQRTPRSLKMAASAILALPAAVLLLFAIGEMVSGDISGAQHLPEAAGLLIIAVAGWRYPRVAGVLLLCVGTMLLLLWLVLVFTQAEIEKSSLVLWIVFGAVLFGMPITAGWLFFKANRTTVRET